MRLSFPFWPGRLAGLGVDCGEARICEFEKLRLVCGLNQPPLRSSKRMRL
jgi:hypothetical protein